MNLKGKAHHRLQANAFDNKHVEKKATSVNRVSIKSKLYCLWCYFCFSI